MPVNTTVERRPGRGRCLIAAKDFDVGELVFETKPLSAVLQDSHIRVRCARCFGNLRDERIGSKGSRCSKCKSIWYCSRDCQKLDWAEHRLECKAWREKAAEDAFRAPTRTLRLAGRIMQLMNRSASPSDSDSTPAPEQVSAPFFAIWSTAVPIRDALPVVDLETVGIVRRDVAELVDHNNDRTEQQQQEYRIMAAYVSSMCVSGGGEGCLTWPSANGRGFGGLVETAYMLIGKLACNAFSITQELGTEVIGCGLYLDAAPANHSCSPNVTQTFAQNGRTLSLRCTKPIKCGEEITVGIITLTHPGHIRRRQLRESYFFDCRCERCSSRNSTLEDARLEGYACPHRDCTGLCAKHRTNPRRGASSAEASSSRASEGSEGTQSSRSDKVDAAGVGGNEEQESTSSRKIPSKTKKKKEENTSNQKADDSDVLVAGEPPAGRGQNYRSRSDDESDGEGIMTCDKCGATRDADETEREGMAIQELLERSQAVAERRVDFPSALKGLEEARDRAISCLYQGNWMVAQIYAALVSVALELEMLGPGLQYATEGIEKQRLCWSALVPYSPTWSNQLAITGKEAASAIEVMCGTRHLSYRNVRNMLAEAEARSGR